MTVSQHALWVGVIGWLASSLQGAGNAGILPAGNTPPTLATPMSILGALAWPVLSCLSVHALGQLSYPGPRLPRRLASLEIRRIRDFLPRGLAWTVAAIFVGSALQIGLVTGLPAYEAVPYGKVQEGSNGFRSIGGDGRIQGAVLAACLGAAWLALALGTALVLKLISRRRQLEALDAVENGLLRTIAMNRLLRTAATIAAGLGAVAGNFAARPDPAANATSWTNGAGAVALVVLLAMWGWVPPKLASAQVNRGSGSRPALVESPATAHPATRLLVSLGTAMALAPMAAAALGLFVPGFLMPGTGFPDLPVLFVAVMAAVVLLVTGAGELLVQRNYGTPGIPRTWPRQVASPALLTTAIGAFVLFTVIAVLTAAGDWELREAGLDSLLSPGTTPNRLPGWVIAAVATAAIAAIAGLPVAAARQRRSISTDIPGLDAALRAITVHRVVRTFAAYCTAQAGVLLMTASKAWPPLVGLPETTWYAATWPPALLAGALLAAVGVVIAVIPVRGFARTPATSAKSVPEGAR
ncbi:MAG TPA: hypothetical protein VFI36_01560 [Arthrobacter sp.]|nr:hypothetical protein [Arthrobacter sp.]